MVNSSDHIGIKKKLLKQYVLDSTCQTLVDKSEILSIHAEHVRWRKTLPSRKTSTLMHPVPVPIKVMLQVGIDLLKMKENTRWISATDYFTKFAEWGALKDKNHSNSGHLDLWEYFFAGKWFIIWLWVQSLIHIQQQLETFTTLNIHQYIQNITANVTNIFISHNGTEFVNKIACELNSRTGYTHRVVSPYHSQAKQVSREVEKNNRPSAHYNWKTRWSLMSRWLRVSFTNYCIGS